MHIKFPTLVLAATVLATTACAPYRADINQGSYLTEELVAQVDQGMTREQVHFLLGSPMIADSFHPHRWDYIYFLDSRYQPDRKAHLVVWFDGDVVERVEVKEPPHR